MNSPCATRWARSFPRARCANGRASPAASTCWKARNWTARARERISAFAALEFYGGEGSLTRQMRARWQRLRVAPSARAVPAPADGYVPPMLARGLFNGYGGFVPDGYCVDVFPGAATPAPWANILANPRFGALVTERGGGFTWYKNSRFGRLTPFDNDPLREGWGEMLYVLEGEEYFLGAARSAGPGRAYRALHAQGYSAFETGTEALHARLTVFVDEKWPVKWLLLALENRTGAEKRLEVRLAVDWLMGVNAADGRVLRSEARAGALFASGAMEGVAFAAILADGAAAVGNLRDFLGSGGLICPDGLLAHSAGGMCWPRRSPCPRARRFRWPAPSAARTIWRARTRCWKRCAPRGRKSV